MLSAALVTAGPPPAAQFTTETAPRCSYTDAARASSRTVLPAQYTLELKRSADTSAVEDACSAKILDRAGRVVWTADAFGVTLHPWTGHDVDGDGRSDAIVGVDTGGGNRCCWAYTVISFAPSFRAANE